MMIDGSNKTNVTAEKSNNKTDNYSQSTQQKSFKNIDNKVSSKVSFFQKILDFLHIKIFNRTAKQHNSTENFSSPDILAKNSLEFDIKYTKDTIETEIDYINAHNKLTIYYNLSSIISYFDDFITNYSTIGAINQDSIIEFLESKTQYIGARLQTLDKKHGEIHSIMPPDISYLQLLDSIELKSVMTQINKLLKNFHDTTFISVGYNPKIEEKKLANSTKLSTISQDLTNPNSFILHVLDTQELTISIPSGNIKLVYADIADAKINNENNLTDTNRQDKINDVDYEQDDDIDIQQSLNKLTDEFQQKNLQDSVDAETIKSSSNQVEDDQAETILARYQTNKKFYYLIYEVDEYDLQI